MNEREHSLLIEVLQNLNRGLLAITLMQLVWLGLWIAYLKGFI